MERVHLYELEDSPLCPAWLRRMAMEVLREVHERLGHYDPVAPLLAELANGDPIVDLCSGAAGPLRRLAPRLGPDVRVVCTDRFPQSSPPGGTISYWSQPVDARSVPSELQGVRTLFTAFHHFDPDDARTVLEDAVLARSPIAIFEITERSWRGMLRVAAFVAACTLAMPFMRPFSIPKLLCTYVVPALPAILLWDGIVSCLRSYSSEELLSLVPPDGDYDWHAGTLPSAIRTHVTYLIGRPKRPANSDDGAAPSRYQRDDEKHQEDYE